MGTSSLEFPVRDACALTRTLFNQHAVAGVGQKTYTNWNDSHTILLRFYLFGHSYDHERPPSVIGHLTFLIWH
jgi:hypothetical protein